MGLEDAAGHREPTFLVAVNGVDVRRLDMDGALDVLLDPPLLTEGGAQWRVLEFETVGVEEERAGAPPRPKGAVDTWRD